MAWKIWNDDNTAVWIGENVSEQEARRAIEKNLEDYKLAAIHFIAGNTLKTDVRMMMFNANVSANVWGYTADKSPENMDYPLVLKSVKDYETVVSNLLPNLEPLSDDLKEAIRRLSNLGARAYESANVLGGELAYEEEWVEKFPK